MAPDDWKQNKEIEILREYLRIESVQPNPNYESCIEFLKRQADDLNLSHQVYYPNDDAVNPLLVITWQGLNPDLPAILLNSHMDVVPAYKEKWSHPPFAADIDDEGRIFARGSQDMKSVGMQYLAAIRALKAEGATFQRTIHLSFVPDEENSGKRGMRPFVETEDFRKLNIGFALDEGIASPTDQYLIFNGERTVWRFAFVMHGTTGHGSLLLKGTPGEKFHYILEKMMTLRKQQVKRLESDPNLTQGDVTTVNLTRLSGGVHSNVIPEVLSAHFDVRLALDVDNEAFETQLKQWCDEAGGDVTIEWEHKNPKVPPTSTSDCNAYWVAFEKAISELGLKTKVEIFTGGTDSRHIRKKNIPALGFSPIINTPVLLHDHNEFIYADGYLRGIEIYKTIIPNLANLA